VEIPMTEEHPFNTRTFYGATKIAGEAMCRAFAERYGLSYAGLRYMNVYGARQDYKGTYIAVIMKILDRLDQGLPPILYGDGSQAYDFIYVSDCARANVCALKSNATDSFYNVGSGTRTSLKELCELILQVTGSSFPIQYEPAGKTFVTNRIGSTKKAEREIGFRTTIELHEGLERLIEWRETHKQLVAERAEFA
jgi:UDP-glucose 4-epimerase